MTNLDSFETTYDIDKNHKDDEVVRVAGQDMRLGDARQYYSKFNERYYKMIIFWDDIIQYTSLGLFDIIFDLYGIQKDIPVEDFFKRFEPIHGLDFVKEYVKKHYKITENEVDTVYKENYEKILKISPLSKNSIGILKMREILNIMHIVFSYEFDTSKIVKDITEKYNAHHVITTDIGFTNGKSTEEYIKTLSDTKKGYIDIVACIDAGAIIDYAIKKNVYELSILTPGFHNGISPGAQIAYIDANMKGPNASELYFLEEAIL